MTKLKKGDLVVESSVPSEIVNLKAQGFRVVKPAVVAGNSDGPHVHFEATPAVAAKPGTPRK